MEAIFDQMQNIVSPHKRFKRGTFIPDAVMSSRFLSQGAKLAYGRLARYEGGNLEAWPGEKELAGELGVSVRQVRRYVAELETKEIIAPVRRGKCQTNLYVFLDTNLFDKQSAQSDTQPIATV